jgi:hypothetical protein
MEFTTVIKIIQLAAAAADAARQAREIAVALQKALQQSGELTPEQSAQLDAEAAAIFAGPTSQPSGR